MREKDFRPCEVEEHDSGDYRLSFDNFFDYQEVFVEEGWDGSGRDWEGVVQAMLASRRPDALDVLEFDSNEDEFVVFAPSLPPLRDVTDAIRDVVYDLDLLSEMIRRADEQGLL